MRGGDLFPSGTIVAFQALVVSGPNAQLSQPVRTLVSASIYP